MGQWTEIAPECLPEASSSVRGVPMQLQRDPESTVHGERETRCPGGLSGKDMTLMGFPRGASLDEMTLALAFERPAYKRSELGRRSNTSRERRQTGHKAGLPKAKECSGKSSILFNKHY